MIREMEERKEKKKEDEKDVGWGGRRGGRELKVIPLASA